MVIFRLTDLLCCVVFLLFLFFKQKTAYEMRISDWSSDVCSSDLPSPRRSRGEGDRREAVVEGRRRCAIAPPSARRAATSPSQRDREDHSTSTGFAAIASRRARSRPTSASVKCSPNLLRRHSTSSVVRAHSRAAINDRKSTRLNP